MYRCSGKFQNQKQKELKVITSEVLDGMEKFGQENFLFIVVLLQFHSIPIISYDLGCNIKSLNFLYLYLRKAPLQMESLPYIYSQLTGLCCLSSLT